MAAELNPNTTTREEWSNNMLNVPIPEDANETWKKFAEAFQDVYKKLSFHEAMRPNLQQTFMTPAASKNKIYFVWDTTYRALWALYKISPTDPPNTGQLWTDVKTRAQTVSSLLLDEPPGMLDMMVDSTYPGQGPRPEIGEELLEAARKLKATLSRN